MTIVRFLRLVIHIAVRTRAERDSVVIGLLLAVSRAIILVSIRIRQDFGVGLARFKQTLQERSAPTASGSGSKALRKFASTSRLLYADVLFYFSPRNVETQAKIIVGFHSEKCSA